MVGGIVSLLTGLVCAGILERCACAFVCCFVSFVEVVCDNLVYNSPALLQVRKDRSLTAHDLYELEAAHDRSERGGGRGRAPDQYSYCLLCLFTFRPSNPPRRIHPRHHRHRHRHRHHHPRRPSRHLGKTNVGSDYPLRCCALLLCCAVRYSSTMQDQRTPPRLPECPHRVMRGRGREQAEHQHEQGQHPLQRQFPRALHHQDHGECARENEACLVTCFMLMLVIQQ